MQQIVESLKPDTKKKLTILLDNDGSEAEVLVAFVGKGKDIFNLITLADHQALHTQSYTMVRGVLFDQSQATVEGMIKIAKGAQHTNAFLEEKILLVGDQARANAIPQLEIEANEVKASHAATVGKLDEEQLFYLMSRGLPHTKAQELLVMGFLQPVVDRIETRDKRQEIKKEIKEALRNH